MQTYQIRLFISHLWQHSGHYPELKQWIFRTPRQVGQAVLEFRDCSPSVEMPAYAFSTKHRAAIDHGIRQSHVVVVPARLPNLDCKWMAEELASAKRHHKPVLAIELPLLVPTTGIAAHKTVAWRGDTVASGIWALYYGYQH